jgi:hypothetical protein
MPTEKLEISWDELNTRQVEQKLRQNDAMERNRQYAQIDAPPEESPVKPSIWYNTIFYMSVFGLLGGLLAWGCGELLHLRPGPRIEALELLSNIQEINHAAMSGKLTTLETDLALKEIMRAGRDNPYFVVMNNPQLTMEEKEQQLDTYRSRDMWKDFIVNVLAYGVAGLVIAACLSMAEAVIDRNIPAMVINGSMGATLGLLGGVIVALFVERLYHKLGGVEGQLTSAKQVFARTITYAVLGVTLTLAPGIVMRNWKKLAIGAAGGLLGGIIGGALYDPIAHWIQNQHISRLIGLVAIGVVAGAASGLIENAAKSGWLRVVQGVIAGKQFVLYRNPTYIGSSPNNQIYIFKDAQVGRRHAAIHLVGGGFEVEDLPLGGATFVNGKPVMRVRLRHGDRVQIGATAFLFQERQPS